MFPLFTKIYISENKNVHVHEMYTWPDLWSSLGEPPVALAAYLAALHLRLSRPEGVVSDLIVDDVLSVLVRHLSSQDLVKARKALEIFLDLMRRTKASERKAVIESMEDEHYETFKSSLYRFLRRDVKLDEVRKIFQTLLDLRRGAGKITKRGSYVIEFNFSPPVTDVENIHIGAGITIKRLRELGFFILVMSWKLQGYYYFCDVIVPAPYVDMDILTLFEEPRGAYAEGAKVEGVGGRAVAPRFEALKPSREVLESIVAEALKALGFSTQTNSRLPAKGGEVEVDVWATKSVGGAQFRVYVSCKNWDRDIDRQVVDHEFGRVLQLHQLPHLRILVARSLTEPARKAAFDDGFFVIELGEKASAGNAQEIYGIVYSKLREIFIGIAPDSVRSVVERLRSALKELEGLM